MLIQVSKRWDNKGPLNKQLNHICITEHHILVMTNISRVQPMGQEKGPVKQRSDLGRWDKGWNVLA